jgi:hypothetical protein
MADRLARALGDFVAGHIARTDDGVIDRPRRAEMLELVRHHTIRARRIGDQHHNAATVAETRQCVAGLGKRGDTVMHHAPDVGEHHVVIARKRGKMIGKDGQGNNLSRWRAVSGRWI